MNYIDANDPAERHKARNRLYHRLKRYGFRLQSGRTLASDGRRMIQLKRVPVQRGFRLTDTSTGEVVAGKNFDLTLEQVDQFWERERMKHIQVKRKEEAQTRKEDRKLRMRSRGLGIDADSAGDGENKVDFGFDWEDLGNFYDD